jgi:hypothetical protein
MEKIPTAEEYITDYYPDQNGKKFSLEQVKRIARGFAIFHVEAALKAAKQKSVVHCCKSEASATYLKECIDNAYPLTNIK